MPRPLASAAAVLAGLLVGPLLSSLQRSRLVREVPLTESGIDAHLRNHSFVHVGGQHRGGDAEQSAGRGGGVLREQGRGDVQRQTAGSTAHF